MKAMAQKSWRKGEALVLIDLDAPVPRPREVRVAVKAIGVNPVDWKMRSSGPLRLAARLIGPAAPVIVGVDFSGVVEAVGDQVASVKPGDQVVGGTNFARGQRGSYADTVIVREDQLCVLPDGFDLEVAAALPVAGVTAWMALMEIGRLRSAPEGQRRVLVLGASGGVGQFAVQMAKAEGAFVAGICSGKNAELVRSLGADAILDYTQGDPLQMAQALRPFRVVVDCVGNAKGGRCRALLGKGGRHVMVAGDRPFAWVQAFIPPFSSKIILGRPTTERLRAVVDLVAAGKVKVQLAHRLPLAEAEEAHRLSQSSRMTGKIVLVT